MTRTEQLYNEWLSLQPLTADNQKRLDDKFMLEFNYNSNHIEGNTLTYGQTKLLLFFGKIESEEGTPFRDFEEMKAHAAGLRWIKELAADKEHRITEHDIKQLNHIILAEDFYKADPNGNRYKVHVGQYKTRPNSVITATGEEFAYASPEETSAMMYALVDWLGTEMYKGEFSPIELAALLHYRYIRIHPFEDGNGRVARLLVTYVLERYGYPMLIIKSNDKAQYLNALNLSDANVGLSPSDGANATIEQIAPFVRYMEKQLEWSLRIAITAAKGESIEEEDDWKKKLAQSLGNKKGAPRITNELKEKARKEVFEALIGKISAEITPFYPLFRDTKEGKDSDGDYYFSFISPNLSNVIYIRADWGAAYQFSIKVLFAKHNEWEKEAFSISKRYDEILSEEEQRTVINLIGKLILSFHEL